MREIEEHISPLVENLFPEFYKEEGPLFITFVKAYYEWLEQNYQTLTLETPANFNVGDTVTQGQTTGVIHSIFNGQFQVRLNEYDSFRCNTLCNDLTKITSSSGGESFIEKVEKHGVIYQARHLTDLKDVDRTIDSFLLDFINKYLPNIQFTTASNKELFIKNAIDFYRAKGTERAIELFFKLIYGLQSRIYYPADDLFKPSDNEWVNIRYLEVEPSPDLVRAIGQFVYGSKTNSSAFVERLVRVRDGGRFVTVLYISNILGEFQTGEQIATRDLATNVTTKIIGSLSTFEINSSSRNFRIGERLYVSNGSGKKAKAIVTELENKRGIYDFGIRKGGWGYTPDAEIISSDNVLQLNDATITNTNYYDLHGPFEQFEKITQPLIQFTVEEEIEFASNVYFYDDANNMVFEGRVVSINLDNLEAVVNYDSTVYSNTSVFLSANALYLEANNLSTSIAISDLSSIDATANVIASGNTFTITYTGDSALLTGDVIIQKNPRGGIFSNAVVIQTNTSIESNTYVSTVRKDCGFFRTDLNFYRKIDNTEYTIQKLSNNFIGIVDVSNTFYNTGFVYGETTGNKSEILFYSFGDKAEFTINSYSNEKQIYLSNVTIDTISSSLQIDSYVGYTNNIDETIDFQNVSLGTIKEIVTTDSGSDQSTTPFYIIKQPIEGYLEEFDWEINVANVDGTFVTGEVITGNTSGAEAEIYSIVDGTIRATRTNLNDFQNDEEIVGSSSDATALIDSVYETRCLNRTGLNASLNTDVENGEGFVKSLQVIDSGFGYYQDEVVTLVSEDDSTKVVSANTNVTKQGVGEGYNANRRSFLSSDKYLHDNVFYQEYSYQVLTSLPFESYKETLIKALHVAGTRPFGAYSTFTESEIPLTLLSDTTTFEISVDGLFVNEQEFFEHNIS